MSNTASSSGDFDQWLLGCNLLLIDDNRAQAARYQAWLTEAGATVTVALHKHGGIGLIARNVGVFDIVIFGEHELAEDSVLLAEHVRVHFPDCALLFHCVAASPALIMRIRRAGAAFLSKVACQADFMFTTSKLVDAEVPNLEVLVGRAQRRWRLSRQQTRLLYYNLWSCSNREIATSLGVSLNTVHEYQQKLRRKTGARTKDGYLRLLLESAGRTPPGIEAKVATD